MRRTLKILHHWNEVMVLVAWLKMNNFKYTVMGASNTPSPETERTTTTFLDIYTDEAEVAIRLKWNVIE
jgi:hypothetical protein